MPLRHCERSEAIHATRKNGLLRRCAPRNDGGARASRHCERSEAIHASPSLRPNGRANARPLTGSAKQEARGWIASSLGGQVAPLRKRFAFVADDDGEPIALHRLVQNAARTPPLAVTMRLWSDIIMP